MTAIISVGSQYDGPEVSNGVAAIPKILKYQGPDVGNGVDAADTAMRKAIVDKPLNGFPGYVAKFAILLRVSGSLGRFEGQPVEEFTFDRKDKSISVDWLVQEAEWHHKTTGQLLRLFAQRMRQTVPYVLGECKRKYIEVDEAAFRESMGQHIEQIEHAASVADAQEG